jgi:hypothetical protein
VGRKKLGILFVFDLITVGRKKLEIIFVFDLYIVGRKKLGSVGVEQQLQQQIQCFNILVCCVQLSLSG